MSAAMSSIEPPAPTVLTTAGIRRGGRWQQVFIPVKNVPGELLRIDKHQLTVDLSYQRKLDRPRVAEMAANWSWVSCGALIVARHERDGREVFSLMDGQHRWEAAMLIEEITDLPCLAFPLDELRDEAIGFLASNVSRKLPNLADQFKALLIAQNSEAVVAERLAKLAGRYIAGGSGPYTITCTSEFLRLIQQDQKAVETCWLALAALCAGYPMSARIMRGVVALQRRMPHGDTFAEKRWSDRLVRVGWNSVNDAIKDLGAVEHNYSERTCAQGVARAINKGLRAEQQLHINWTRVVR